MINYWISQENMGQIQYPGLCTRSGQVAYWCVIVLKSVQTSLFTDFQTFIMNITIYSLCQPNRSEIPQIRIYIAWQFPLFIPVTETNPENSYKDQDYTAYFCSYLTETFSLFDLLCLIIYAFAPDQLALTKGR